MFGRDVPCPISPSHPIGREVAPEKRNLDPLAGRLVVLFYVWETLSLGGLLPSRGFINTNLALPIKILVSTHVQLIWWLILHSLLLQHCIPISLKFVHILPNRLKNHNFPGPQLARIWGTPQFSTHIYNGSPEEYAGLVPQRSTIGFQVNHLCRVVSCDCRCDFQMKGLKEPTVDTKIIGSRLDMLEESEQGSIFILLYTAYHISVKPILMNHFG